MGFNTNDVEALRKHIIEHFNPHKDKKEEGYPQLTIKPRRGPQRMPKNRQVEKEGEREEEEEEEEGKTNVVFPNGNDSKNTVEINAGPLHFIDQTDDGKQPLIHDVVKCTWPVESIVCSCRWKDQGRDSVKGRIFLRVLSSNGNFKYDIDLFGFVAHDWKTSSNTLDVCTPILRNICPGDALHFIRYVGGEGYEGTFDILKSSYVFMCVKIIDQNATPKNVIKIEEGDLRIVEQKTDGKTWLIKDVIKCHSVLESLKVECEWKDQDQENHKSRIYLRVIDAHDNMKQDYDLFGIAPHVWTSKVVSFDCSSKIIQTVVAGDSIRFVCYVGLGDGHELLVRQFSVIATFPVVTDIARIELRHLDLHGQTCDEGPGKKVPFVSDVVKCDKPVHSIALSCEWKGQGRGAIFLRLVPPQTSSNGWHTPTLPRSDVQDLDCFGVAPDTWESASACFTAANSEWISLIQPGYEIKFFCFVGSSKDYRVLFYLL
ncbi:hypothetical protein RFI_04562 [Reticulomyxa filosa]|uniref:Uncharacterized protein n=1 Tax=Reticulomyxa filosa TaxID=46433 RepID=X6P2U0_RETFI|nr:hypothetical protein RFI_04562 [Reticulomyxa filosa]|eukprot:ETO32556.1 hypothetical protein RFI_04562 [Reticulomyxa filosa]